jgi:TrmH family RNA methyltransferase
MEQLQNSELTKQVMKRAVSFQKKKFRNIDSVILIEGLLPLMEAVESQYVITDVFYNPFLLNKPGVKELLISLQEKHQTRCYEVSGSELKQISTEVTPQGIVALAEQRDYEVSDLKGNLLVLDKLQDPGNVGTLFRIAHWFGLGGLVLMKGTVDAHNPKVVRSSMGSFFHLPFIYADELDDDLLNGRTLLLSKAHSDKTIQEIVNEKITPFLLVIGNEARGVDEGFDHYDHRDLTLPALGGAESLNAAVAAAAILSKLLY